MPDHDEKHHRRSIRLSEYDYRQEGAYFVTVCTHQRACLFGDVIGDAVMLTTLGCIVLEEWERTAIARPYVILDEFVIMPNHVHGIIVIDYGADGVGARRAVPDQTPVRYFGQSIPRALSTIVGAFKSAATNRINRVRETPGAPVWQRNYYEHVIRDEKSLNAIREYIQFNPARWAMDKENPANVKG